jgi:hypothetical protein
MKRFIANSFRVKGSSPAYSSSTISSLGRFVKSKFSARLPRFFLQKIKPSQLMVQFTVREKYPEVEDGREDRDRSLAEV